MPLHPAIAARLHILEGMSPLPDGPLDPETVARFEAFGAWPDAVPPPNVDVRDDRVPGPHGPVPVRIYRPRGPGNLDRPGLVWMHGGGFTSGDLDMGEADGVSREICARAGAVVVSVDYRLAVGGVTYPVPHDDVVAAVRWVRDDAAGLGIDPERISVGGASAGGNLAAGAALRVRDDDCWLPAHLILAYTRVHAMLPPLSPQLRALQATLPPTLRFTTDALRRTARTYIGGPESRADGYAMPGNADLDGLSPVVLVNAEYDDVRAGGEAFAALLAVAGVDVQQVLVPGLLHGFLNIRASALEPVDAALALMAAEVARVGLRCPRSSASREESVRMPLHPRFAARLHLLDGMTSIEAALADPELAPRLLEFMSAGEATVPPTADTRDVAVSGPHGPVPVRVYRPPGGSVEGRPGLVWVHGGAFRMGSVDDPQTDAFAREMCARAGAVVVSVDYRLAVDGVHYPVPHDDVVAALRWVRESASALGIDPGRISLGGDSAGGNLSTGAALRVRDEDDWTPAALLLAYPALHPVIPPLAPGLATAVAELPEILRFLPPDFAAIRRNYLGGRENTADGYAMPGLAVLDGLCPTVVVNAEHDDLRASGEAFVAALARAGVDVQQHTARGMLHAFLALPDSVEPAAHVRELFADRIRTARSRARMVAQ